MAQTEDMRAVVTERDRERMRQLGAWKASLPPLSPPPPRTLAQVFAINERLRRMAGGPRRDDALAVEEHVRFRTELRRLDAMARAGHAPTDQ